MTRGRLAASRVSPRRAPSLLARRRGLPAALLALIMALVGLGSAASAADGVAAVPVAQSTVERAAAPPETTVGRAAADTPATRPPATEGRAEPGTSVADLEDEVMCPICGTLLELANSPQAERQRAFVAGLIAEGRTKEEIKDALVTEYGREVLAVPEGSGFELSAYAVPAIAFLAAVVALAIGVRRWRRDTGPPRGGQPGTGPSGEDSKRLDEDLARYDL